MKFFFISLIGISLIILLVPHIVYLVVKALSLVFHFRCSYRPYAWTALGLVGLWIVLAVYGNVWGRFFHEQKAVEFKFANLPESFRGYKIVHLSDMHLDGWAGHEEQMQQIVDEVNALDADMIVFTGDLVSLNENELTTFLPVLKQLKAKDGVYSILGNHDYMPYNHSWTDREREQHIQHLIKMERENLGWKLLMNENCIIHHGSDSIAICGSENKSMGIHSVVSRGDLKKTFKGTDGCFRILLTHDPTHWRGEVLGKYDVPLTLSGHTHGGQMSIFGFHVSAFIYKEHAGHYEENGQHLYVNLGIGGTMPMRVGATPEITVIELGK